MQLDQPALVLSRQMYVENTDGKYDEYIAAYKALTIDVAQLMAYENGGNGPSIDELESFWINLFQIESTIAKVLVILFLFTQLGIDIKAIAASLGVGGIAIALASKDTLANFFGSLNIMTDKMEYL